MIVVTHNFGQARRISDYTAFMHRGELIEYGKTAKLFQNPEHPLTEAYITLRVHAAEHGLDEAETQEVQV